MPVNTNNAVFNGDYNDYGSNFYFMQVNETKEGTDISINEDHHLKYQSLTDF